MDHYGLVKDCLKGKPAAQKQLYTLFAGPMLADVTVIPKA
jgi:RNA polymerase sigma-70 factor (ECF subfamily)